MVVRLARQILTCQSGPGLDNRLRLKTTISPLFLCSQLSVFSASEWYAKLHRTMSLLDEENIKILETMKQHGPRNLQQISRKSKLPYTTVYGRVAKLQSLNALRT